MTLSINDTFNKSWDAIKNSLPLVAGLTLVYGVGIAAISMIPIVGNFLSTPFTAGYMYCLIKIRRGDSIDYPDVFWAFMDFNRLGQLLLAGAITGLLTILGFILLVVPGVWFIVASSLTTAFLVLKDTDALTAIRLSKDSVRGNWWKVLLLLIAMGLLVCAGMMCFFIGVLIALPVSSLMLITAAETLSHIEGKDPQSGTGSSSVFTVNPQ